MAFIEFSEIAGETVVGPRVPATLAAKAVTPLNGGWWNLPAVTGWSACDRSASGLGSRGSC